MSVIVSIVGSSETARSEIVQALDGAPAEWVIRLDDEFEARADVTVCDPDAERPDGAIVFDGTCDLVEHISERVSKQGRAILVSAPSGGTGATSVALHLAAELAARQHRTALVDVDPARGAHARLGLDTEADPAAPIPVPGGFRILPGIEPSEGFARVVIDTPPASLPDVGPVDAGVLVCVPTPQGARRALRVLEDHPEIPWHVVVNRLGPGGETTRAQFERSIGRAVAIELPCCPALRDAEDGSVLLKRGWTRWSRRVGRLAASVDA